MTGYICWLEGMEKPLDKFCEPFSSVEDALEQFAHANQISRPTNVWVETDGYTVCRMFKVSRVFSYDITELQPPNYNKIGTQP